jgi:hypothetical protein
MKMETIKYITSLGRTIGELERQLYELRGVSDMCRVLQEEKNQLHRELKKYTEEER